MEESLLLFLFSPSPRSQAFKQEMSKALEGFAQWDERSLESPSLKGLAGLFKAGITYNLVLCALDEESSWEDFLQDLRTLHPHTPIGLVSSEEEKNEHLDFLLPSQMGPIPLRAFLKAQIDSSKRQKKQFQEMNSLKARLARLKAANVEMEIHLKEKTHQLEKEKQGKIRWEERLNQKNSALEQKVAQLFALNRMTATFGQEEDAGKILDHALSELLFLFKARTALRFEGAEKDFILRQWIGKGVEGREMRLFRDSAPLLTSALGMEQCLNFHSEITTLGKEDGAFFSAVGLAHLIIIPVNRDYGTLFILGRGEDQGPFSSEDMSLAETFLGFLRGAVTIESLLKREKEARSAAERNAKAKTDFLAAVSHEIRTPMNGIIGFTQLLLDRALPPEEMSYLQIIMRSSDHLLQLISEILQAARLEDGKVDLDLQPVDLYALIGEVGHMVEMGASKKGLKLSLEKEASLPRFVLSDGAKLRQILINLLANGIKFTHRGSVKLEVRLKKDRLLFMVKDTGQGIAEQDIPRLFEPFFQAHQGQKNSEGTGLGLGISQQLIRLFGGSLSVDSQLGVGSEFSFHIPYLPLEEQEDFLLPSRVLTLEPPLHHRYSFLILEHLKHSSGVVRSLLSSYAQEIRTVHCKDKSDPWFLEEIDLLILNLSDKNLNDRWQEICKGRRIEQMDFGLLILTPKLFLLEQKDLRAAVLQKPFTEGEFWDKVRSLLPQEKGYSRGLEEGEPLEVFSSLRISQDLPEYWREDLKNAILTVDDELILHVMDRFPGSDDLRAVLEEKIGQYDYQWILDRI